MWTTLSPRALLLLVFVLLMMGTLASGQQEDEEEDCAVVLQASFEQATENCAGLELGGVCYGTGGLRVTFYVDGESRILSSELELLTEPGDHAALLDPDELMVLESLRGAPFSILPQETPEVTETLEPTPEVEVTPEVTPEATAEVEVPVTGEWGIGVVYASAGLPRQSDAGVRVMLVGDARIENGVLPEEAFTPGKPIEVSVSEANIYTAPPDYPLVSEVIDVVSGTFEADAVSADGEWVRVFYLYPGRFAKRAAAWLEVSSLEDEPDLSDLPILEPQQFAPMQRLYLTSARMDSECAEAPPPGVLLQGADDLEIDFMINDIPVSLSTSAYFRQVSPKVMWVTALDGIVVLFPGEEREIVLVPGFATNSNRVCLEGPDDYGIDGVKNDFRITDECEFERPLLMGSRELALFSVFSGVSEESAFASVPRVEVVRASGEGVVVPIVVTDPPEALEELVELCQQDELPDYICNFINR